MIDNTIHANRRHLVAFKGAQAPTIFFASLILSIACAKTDRTPEGAMELFLDASRRGSGKEIYALLAPRSRKTIVKLAQSANAGTGREQRYKPEDLLMTAQAPKTYKIDRIEVINVSNSQARIRLIGTRRSTTVTKKQASAKLAQRAESEVWQLVKVTGHWRVVLPEQGLQDATQ